LNGKQVSTIHTVISADGKTITRTVNALDQQGKPQSSKEVYNRQ
jgi:hypothetical protein